MGYLIIAMGAVRQVAGLFLKTVKSGTATFWKHKFAGLIGTQAQGQAHKKRLKFNPTPPVVPHPSLLLDTPQYSGQCTKVYVTIAMGAQRPGSGLRS